MLRRKRVLNHVRDDSISSEPITRCPIDFPKKRRFSEIMDFPDEFKEFLRTKDSSKQEDASIDYIDSRADDVKLLEPVLSINVMNCSSMFCLRIWKLTRIHHRLLLWNCDQDFGFLPRGFEFDMENILLVAESMAKLEGKNYDIICQTENSENPKLGGENTVVICQTKLFKKPKVDCGR